MPTSKSKYSPIMPIALFQSLVDYQREHGVDIVGDYFLLLAHDVLDHPQEYADIFHGRSQVPEDSFVILDNSVIELGKPLESEKLLRAAEIVQPNCIVLPDVLGDMTNSVVSTRKAYAELIANPDTPDDIQLMGVLQGRNVAELIHCASLYAELEHITYYGCPRWVANNIGTRKVFETVLGIHHEVKNPCAHMLGMSQNVYDDIECTKYPGVMGIDSANPCVMGQRGIPLNRLEGYRHMQREEGSFDYWKETVVTQQTVDNILTMRRLLASGNR